MERYGYNVSGRILNRSIKRDSGCIEYRGDKQLKHKYGLVSITVDKKRKSIPVHRAMYMALNDCFDLPRTTVIRHSCDNPRCVNKDHLFLGSQKDNIGDMLGRGRKAKKHKLHTRLRKFDADTISAIRNAEGKLKYVAEKFGTTIGYVSKLRNGKAKTLVV